MIGRLGRVVAVCALIGVASLTSPPTGGALTDGAVDRFGSCLNAQKAGQVLILIDESGSLAENDPDDARVTAANFLVKRLTQFSADSGAAIDVGVAGFSENFAQSVDWTRLTESSLPSVQAGIDAFRERDAGGDTDYWQALNGARVALTDRREEGVEAVPCQALAWFTDGKIDFSTRSGTEKPYAPGIDLGNQEGIDATIRAAQEDICRPGGVADQLRSSGIVTFGIGLSPDPDKSGDFDVMKSIVTGAPTTTGSCGDITAPTPGEFYLAQDIDQMLMAFDAFSTPGSPPIQIETGVCPGTTVCEEAKHSFVLDRSVRSVSALANADSSGLIPLLVPPIGDPQQLQPGAAASLDIGGVDVEYEWLSDKSVSFRMTNATAPAWQGQWALVFQDPSGTSGARTRSSLHIAGDLYPVWAQHADTTLYQDEIVPVSFSVADGDQQPVDPNSLLGTADLSATLIDAKGDTHQVVTAQSKDQITTQHQLNLNGVPLGRATLRLSLSITTAPATRPDGMVVSGTALAPQSVDLPVVVNPPVGYPAVGTSVDFGDLEGVGSRTASLEITGAGCAWVVSEAPVTVVAGPEGVPAPRISSPASEQSNCVASADGETVQLPLTAEVTRPGNGAVNGTIQITVAPKDGAGPPIMVDVPFTLSMQKELNSFALWTTLAVALLLGPGIPLGLLYLTKWLASRIPGKALRVEKFPVRVSGNTVLRNGQPFAVGDGELVQLVQGLTGPTRRLDIGDIELRARIGLSPFGPGFVVASSPGLAGAAGQSGASHGGTPDAKLPLAVQNTWFLLHDPNGAEDAATVVLLVGGDAGRPVIGRLVAEVREAVPRILPDLRQRARISAPPADNVQPPSGEGPFASSAPFGPSTGGNPFTGGAAPSGGNPFQAAPSRPGGGNPFGTAGGQCQAPPPPGPAGQNPFGPGPQSGSAPPNPFRPD